ncbi:hypothetical protein RRF57_007810 [Xylaria bambusicola]|uniref:Uncharacterized protein n=1 Tax=Xylaria bambusicola TaxID=326684 RepID=A0AAN7UUA1_9PEZI
MTPTHYDAESIQGSRRTNQPSSKAHPDHPDENELSLQQFQSLLQTGGHWIERSARFVTGAQMRLSCLMRPRNQ